MPPPPQPVPHGPCFLLRPPSSRIWPHSSSTSRDPPPTWPPADLRVTMTTVVAAASPLDDNHCAKHCSDMQETLLTTTQPGGPHLTGREPPAGSCQVGLVETPCLSSLLSFFHYPSLIDTHTEGFQTRQKCSNRRKPHLQEQPLARGHLTLAWPPVTEQHRPRRRQGMALLLLGCLPGQHPLAPW